MCGRFSLTSDLEVLVELFQIEEWSEGFTYTPRYNIAPTQNVLSVINFNGKRKAGYLKWGLVPFWAKDMSIGSKLINARAETLHEKPSFKHSLKKRRCIILADGFYEWKKTEKTKTPMRFQLNSKKPFAFAGLWDRWKDDKGYPVTTCTIVTTTPNRLLKNVHNRMPVILSEQNQKVWLDENNDNLDSIGSILKPFPEEEMLGYEVSKLVNSPRNDVPEIIEPIS